MKEVEEEKEEEKEGEEGEEEGIKKKKRKSKRRTLLPVGQLCLSAGCCDPLVTIKMKCPSAAIFSVWSICF